MSLYFSLRNLFSRFHDDLQKIGSGIESATAEYKAEKAKDRPAPIITSILHRPQAEIDNAEFHAARHERRDNVRLRVEVFGLFIASILAVATVGLWLVTRESTRIAGLAAKAAQEGAQASAAQADATKQSIDATVNQFRLDQRAWVAITTMDLAEPRANAVLRAQAQIANTGKTPAFNVVVVNGGVQTNYGELDVDKFIRSGKLHKTKHPTGTSVIFPNSSQKLPFATEESLTEKQVLEIANHILWVYLFGEIHYKDAFGGIHLTVFCAVYEPTTRGFDICMRHNSAD